MKPDEKKVVALSFIAILVVAGGFVLFSSNLFACLSNSCIGSGGPNPITGTQNVFIDVTSSSGIVTESVSAQVLPNAGTTGEVVKSCQWVTCALTGTETTATIVVTGPKTFSTTWVFKLGFEDKEEYIWEVPALPSGTYTVTISLNVQGGSGTAQASGSFTVPLNSVVQLSGG